MHGKERTRERSPSPSRHSLIVRRTLEQADPACPVPCAFSNRALFCELTSKQASAAAQGERVTGKTHLDIAPKQLPLRDHP